MPLLTQQIRTAINASDLDTARILLRDALKTADAETYYLAAQVALDDAQQRLFLHQALEADPFHEDAYKMHKNICSCYDAQLSSASIQDTGCRALNQFIG